jgi:DNA ligase-1
MSSLQTVEQTPTLETKTSKGLKKFWIGRVVTDGEHYYLQREFWQLKANGEESRRQVSEPVLVEGKNIGKTNETLPEGQARFELKSLVNKQRDKNYREEGEELGTDLVLPMLAHKFLERGKNIVYPVVTQPKLDGVRCLYETERGFWSRKGKPNIEKVTCHLGFGTKTFIVDGELILHPEFGGFQDTASAVKKFDPEASPHLEYHLYDLVDEDMPFSDRYALLQELVNGGAPPGVKLVPNLLAYSEADIKAHHGAYMEAGFEGTIVRVLDSEYKAGGFRSTGLLKYKDFDDGEFEIIGAEQGKGKDLGTCKFVCNSPPGAEKKTFVARMKGNLRIRREYWDNREAYMGKELIVRYQGFTDDGAPRFPVGVVVRDYE